MLPGESGDNVAVEAPNDYVLYKEETEPTQTEEAPKAPEPEHSEEQSEEQDTSSEAHKPKRGGFQKKIEKLGAAFAQEQEARQRAEAELERLRSGGQKSPDQPNGKPTSANFETYDDYIDALTDWKAEQVVQKSLSERDKKTQAEQVQVQQLERVQTYKQKADTFKEVNTDFDDVIGEYQQSGYVTPLIESVIMDSDMGPQVAYFLASNPEEAMKLADMGVAALNKAIGKIEAKLETQGTQKAAVKTTNAPQPITPVGRNASTANKSIYDDNVPFEEYKAMREKQSRR